MSRRQFRSFILATAVVPPIGLVVAIALAWNHIFFWSDLLVLLIMYSVCFIGVTVGFHRLLAHRSFSAVTPVRLALAVAGAMAAQGQPIVWVSHHRRHHRFADKEGDPHSPHLPGRADAGDAWKGLWHAHMGWLLEDGLSSEPMRYCPDLVREKGMRWISEHMLLVVIAGILLPGVLGLAISGSVTGALTGLLWGGLIRILFVNQITYAVNSVGHYFGRRRFATADRSHNVAWLAMLSFGEGWHNNHHAFPRSAVMGLRWWELDMGAWLIRALEWTGLASKVTRVNPDQLVRKDRQVVPSEDTDPVAR
jgi:stearoyl-CoA desaturase (delta-9 desaturase)